MNADFDNIKEMMRDVERTIEQDRERMKERYDFEQVVLKVMDSYSQLAQENERLRESLTKKEDEADELREQVNALDLKVSEMSKLSAGMVKKSPQVDVVKVIRSFLNISKRKILAKRSMVKSIILELIMSNKMDMPEDVMDLLYSLDDEQIDSDVPTDDSPIQGEPPFELLTADALLLWQGLRDAGFVENDSYMLTTNTSSNQAAFIADQMAERLGIVKKWKIFEQLWGLKNLAQLAGSWQQTGKLPPRAAEIRKILG